MANLEKTIYTMLTEGTGTHMLDSGGTEGRHWQHNQKRTLADFQKESPVSFDIPKDATESTEIEYSISVFHYLTQSEYFELDELCDTFNSKYVPAPDWESDIYGVSTKGAKWLERQGFEIGDSFNTYNHESSLSQVLQGTYLMQPGSVDRYVLLQIHQGADVRGGYADARLFKLPNEWMPSESIYCTMVGANGSEYQLENGWNGYSLTDERGNAVAIPEGATIEGGL